MAMKHYMIPVYISGDNLTEAEAARVADERLGHDEDYGFDYFLGRGSVRADWNPGWED